MQIEGCIAKLKESLSKNYVDRSDPSCRRSFVIRREMVYEPSKPSEICRTLDEGFTKNNRMAASRSSQNQKVWQ